MDVDGDLDGDSGEDEAMDDEDAGETELVPMPSVEGGIDALRQRLHDKVEKLRKNKRGGERLLSFGLVIVLKAIRRTFVER